MPYFKKLLDERGIQARRLGQRPAVADVGDAGGHPARFALQYPGLPLLQQAGRPPVCFEPPRRRRRTCCKALERWARACSMTQGFSLNNWATGNAEEVMLTFASGAAGLKMLGPSNNLFQFFANFNNVQQVFAGVVADLWREWREARYQRKHDILPRIHRGYAVPAGARGHHGRLSLPERVSAARQDVRGHRLGLYHVRQLRRSGAPFRPGPRRRAEDPEQAGRSDSPRS